MQIARRLALISCRLFAILTITHANKHIFVASICVCMYVNMCVDMFFFVTKCMHFFKYSPPYDSHHPYNGNFKLWISLATIYIRTYMRAFTHTHAHTESPKILFWFVWQITGVRLLLQLLFLFLLLFFLLFDAIRKATASK